MKNLKGRFSNEELEELKKIGVVFDSEHDYSEDELLTIHEKITDDFPYEYNSDHEGQPKRLGRIFESIIDKFSDDLNI
ncbi:MAG: hypothetical protein LKJ17_12180 [Oscillospiraceae bacterium]|nr:hypothetical protein [Oscillospiraceae bacterium]